MRLDNFDLNLLIALEILLEERSVTRAAERLNLTQSAMSAALKRLRQALGDDLLVPHGRGMLATAHARALAPMVSQTISDLRVLIAGAAAFDPATTKRRFLIAASDYIATVLLSSLLPQLKREAPGLEINIILPGRDSGAMLHDGKLDLQLTPEEFLNQEHPSELLFEERQVVVGWTGNPVFEGELTEDLFLSCGHIAVQITEILTFSERHMIALRDRRRVELTVPSFSLVPWLLPGTNLLAVMHERLARLYQPLLPLEIRTCPVPIPPMREMIQHHTARNTDAGIIWLKEKLLASARTCTPIRAP